MSASFLAVLRTKRLIVAALLSTALVTSGCTRSSQTEEMVPAPGESVGQSDDLFEVALGNVDRLEEFDARQMLQQIATRLNDWVRESDPTDDWEADPLLPEAAGDMDSLVYRLPDSLYLRQADWMREIGKTAIAGPALTQQLEEIGQLEVPLPTKESLGRALKLFDWVVRNVQLDAAETDLAENLPEAPWIVAARGHGTAIERAWLFAALGKQQGLSIVLLAAPAAEGEQPRIWLPAVVTGTGGAGDEATQLYLFDTELGLPVPGPEGEPIATLAAARETPAVLEALSIAEGPQYGWSTEEIQELIAIIPEDPESLSRRMRTIEVRLSGNQKLILTARPSLLATRLENVPGIVGVQLWDIPFEVWGTTVDAMPVDLQDVIRPEGTSLTKPFSGVIRSLAEARVRHLKGDFIGREGATVRYQQARPTNVDISKATLTDQAETAIVNTKQDASYWLGLAAFERGNYSTAANDLRKRSLEAWPTGRWAPGARYNLARAQEALGKTDEAVALLRADDSPQRHGNLLRAARIETAHQAEQPEF